MTRFQRMHWYEPPEFSRAKAREEKSGSHIMSILLIAFCFSSVFLIADWPETLEEFFVVILLAVTVGSLITFVWWVIAQAPSNVSLDPDKIVIGGDSTKLTDVDFAAVGTTILGGAEFPVLRIQTTGGHIFVAGLTSKINPAELIRAFEECGVIVK